MPAPAQQVLAALLADGGTVWAEDPLDVPLIGQQASVIGPSVGYRVQSGPDGAGWIVPPAPVAPARPGPRVEVFGDKRRLLGRADAVLGRHPDPGLVPVPGCPGLGMRRPAADYQALVRAWQRAEDLRTGSLDALDALMALARRRPVFRDVGLRADGLIQLDIDLKGCVRGLDRVAAIDLMLEPGVACDPELTLRLPRLDGLRWIEFDLEGGGLGGLDAPGFRAERGGGVLRLDVVSDPTHQVVLRGRTVRLQALRMIIDGPRRSDTPTEDPLGAYEAKA